MPGTAVLVHRAIFFALFQAAFYSISSLAVGKKNPARAGLFQLLVHRRHFCSILLTRTSREKVKAEQLKLL
jgi:hypothetical protein